MVGGAASCTQCSHAWCGKMAHMFRMGLRTSPVKENKTECVKYSIAAIIKLKIIDLL